VVHYEYMLSVKERGFLHILVLLIILAGIIGGLYLVQHPAIFQPKARNDQTRIEFVDNSGNEITSTTSQNVKIKLTYVASSATTSVQSVSTTNGKLIAQAGSGSISASPTTCTITSGTTCSSTIAWDTVGVPDTVSVYADGNLFAQGRYGSLVAPWIGTNGNTFELRDNNGVSLGSVFVRGVTASPGSGSTAIVASPATCVFGVGGADSTRCGTTVNWSASGYSGVTVTFTRSSTHGCYSTIWNAPSGLQTVNWIDETGYYFNLCANNNSTYISQVFIKGIPASFPTHFKIANSQSELGTAQEQTFDTNGKIIDWVLPSGTGQKTVYAQFKVDGFWLSNIFIATSIEYTPFFIGPNYYATGTNFDNSSFIGKYQDVNVRNTVKSQLQSMADSGATVVKTVIWLANTEDDTRGWVSTIPLSNQQLANIRQYTQDVASIQTRDGHRLDLYFAFAYSYCADYNIVKSNGIVGECGLTWSQFTDKTRESYTNLINNVSDIKRSDGQKVVKIIYLKHEVMVGTDQLPNEGRFLVALYPDFVQKVSAVSITPSIYFQASMPEDFLLENNFTDGQYPVLNGHKSMFWVWRTTEFMRQNNLPIPDRIDYSLYIDKDSRITGIPSSNYSTFVKKVLDDTESLYPGKKIGVVETHYSSDKSLRDSIGQAFANEHVRRPTHNPETVIFWTTPDGGVNGDVVGFPFDFNPYYPGGAQSANSFRNTQAANIPIIGGIVNLFTQNQNSSQP